MPVHIFLLFSNRKCENKQQASRQFGIGNVTVLYVALPHVVYCDAMRWVGGIRNTAILYADILRCNHSYNQMK